MHTITNSILRRRPTGRQRRARAPLTIGTTVVACTVVLAACGSSTKHTGSSAGGSYAQGLSFARCMRSHGVPSFPDPSSSGARIVGNSFGAFALPASINMQSPAFRSALNACRESLPGGGSPRAGISASEKRSMLEHAQCMRAHGVPNYPDPNIPSHGPIYSGPPAGINTNSPAYRHAAAVCGGG
jgi:hypothetical protein